MSLSYNDTKRYEMTTRERGRVAFWECKEIFVNPHTNEMAIEWRDGWQAGEAEFQAQGGKTKTSAELRRLRPRDLPASVPARVIGTARSAGRVRADHVRDRAAAKQSAIRRA